MKAHYSTWMWRRWSRAGRSSELEKRNSSRMTVALPPLRPTRNGDGVWRLGVSASDCIGLLDSPTRLAIVGDCRSSVDGDGDRGGERKDSARFAATGAVLDSTVRPTLSAAWTCCSTGPDRYGSTSGLATRTCCTGAGGAGTMASAAFSTGSDGLGKENEVDTGVVGAALLVAVGPELEAALAGGHVNVEPLLFCVDEALGKRNDAQGEADAEAAVG